MNDSLHVSGRSELARRKTSPSSEQRDRETERQRDRDPEIHSNGEKEDTHDTKESLPLAASVTTVQEAVKRSLTNGVKDDCIFNFCRALLALAVTTGCRLKTADLQSAFSLWWVEAKPLLPLDADFDEWRFVFENTYSKTRVPLGANPLEEAIRRSGSRKLPAQAARYPSPNLKKLISVCYQLQVVCGAGVFFLSVRDARKITEIKSLDVNLALLAGLVRDRVLIEVKKGKPGGRTATRFRFNAEEFNQHENEPER